MRGPGVARERHRAVRYAPRPLQPRVAALERLVKTADPQERVLASRDTDGHGAAALQHDRGLLAAGVVVLPAAYSVYCIRRRRPAVCQSPMGCCCRWRPMDRGPRRSARGAEECDGSSSSSSIHCVPGLAFVRMGTPQATSKKCRGDRLVRMRPGRPRDRSVELSGRVQTNIRLREGAALDAEASAKALLQRSPYRPHSWAHVVARQRSTRADSSQPAVTRKTACFALNTEQS